MHDCAIAFTYSFLANYFSILFLLVPANGFCKLSNDWILWAQKLSNYINLPTLFPILQQICFFDRIVLSFKFRWYSIWNLIPQSWLIRCNLSYFERNIEIFIKCKCVKFWIKWKFNNYILTYFFFLNLWTNSIKRYKKVYFKNEKKML